jgi:hypothetical protein
VFQVDAGSFAPVDGWSVCDTAARTRPRKRRVAKVVVAIGFVVLNAAAMHLWLTADSTHDRLRGEQRLTQAEVNAHRADLAALRAREAEAVAALELLTAQRDKLVEKTSRAGAATVSARTRSKTERHRAAVRRARIDSLSACLAELHKAMNTLSVGDAINGKAAVETLTIACADAQ